MDVKFSVSLGFIDLLIPSLSQPTTWWWRKQRRWRLLIVCILIEFNAKKLRYRIYSIKWFTEGQNRVSCHHHHQQRRMSHCFIGLGSLHLPPLALGWFSEKNRKHAKLLTRDHWATSCASEMMALMSELISWLESQFSGSGWVIYNAVQKSASVRLTLGRI